MTDNHSRKPLYRQVHDIVVRKLMDGVWRPGEMLPSEQALAAEVGVSQGTVRKVLDALTAEHLLERHQGKGTFVAENTSERALWRFFRIAHPDGKYLVPQSIGAEIVKLRAARPDDQSRLKLEKGAKVVEIVRVRTIEGVPAIREKIVVPSRLFPHIEKRKPLVNTIYTLYQTAYGVHVTSVRDELRPALATEADARVLPVTAGEPVLHIDRIAFSFDDLRVEWRVSTVAMKDRVYAVTLF